MGLWPFCCLLVSYILLKSPVFYKQAPLGLYYIYSYSIWSWPQNGRHSCAWERQRAHAFASWESSWQRFHSSQEGSERCLDGCRGTAKAILVYEAYVTSKSRLIVDIKLLCFWSQTALCNLVHCNIELLHQRLWWYGSINNPNFNFCLITMLRLPHGLHQLLSPIPRILWLLNRGWNAFN